MLFAVVLCVTLFTGEKNSVLVVPTHPDMVYNLTTLKLIDLKGTEFQEIPLHPVPDKPGLYQGSTFLPPNDFFHLGVSAELLPVVLMLLGPSCNKN
jgi:hypothetical protein